MPAVYRTSGLERKKNPREGTLVNSKVLAFRWPLLNYASLVSNKWLGKKEEPEGGYARQQ